MAQSSAPKVLTYTAGGTIVKGHAVKFDSTDASVIEGTANTDKVIGIAQNDASSGQAVEVALQGGGGKAVLGENVTRGGHLVCKSDGTLEKVNGTTDHVIAKAMESGSSGETIGVEVFHGSGYAAE